MDRRFRGAPFHPGPDCCGLLILPKLWAQTRARRRRGELVSRTEILLRLNYMASITWASFSLILMMAWLNRLALCRSAPKTSAAATDPKQALDWRAVLYHGNAKERVPLRVLHAAEGSYQSVINEQRLPDADVSLLSTIKMRVGIGKMRVSIGLLDADRRQTGGSQYHE